MHEKAINCYDKAIILNLNEPIFHLNKDDLLLNLERMTKLFIFLIKLDQIVN